MTRVYAAAVAAALALAPAARADDAGAVLEKAAKALGGADELEKVKAFTFTGKGSISLMGQDSEITVTATYQRAQC